MIKTDIKIVAKNKDRKQFKTCLNRKYSYAILTILLSLFCTFLSALAIAQSSKSWVAPASANQLKNPLAGNTGILKDAKQLYISTCAPCHGNSGKGDGIAAAGLKPKPADHTSAAVQSETDGSLFWKMSDGHTPMPAYKNALTDKQRWELVNYIRSLAKHK